MNWVGAELPETVLIGKAVNEWPLHIFEHEAHAIVWIAKDISTRRLFRCKLEVLEHLEYIPPGEAKLVPKS